MSVEFAKQLELWLDRAQKDYLLNGLTAYRGRIRRSRNFADYYQGLEIFLRDHPKIVVTNFRATVEGRVKVSRPSEVEVSLETLLHYRPFIKLLKPEVEEWREKLLAVGVPGFFENSYSDCLRDPAVTRSCLHVFASLLERDQDDAWILPRQVGHSESTKLIGQEGLLLKLFSFWRGEDATWSDFYRRFRLLRRPAEFRIFAPNCGFQGAQLAKFHGLLSLGWQGHYDFSYLKQCLIVENRETFDVLCPKATQTLLVFGGGWKVSQLVQYHSILPRPLYYWGDMDKEGFEILAYLRERVPDVQPFMMDAETLKLRRPMAAKKAPYMGPFRNLGQLQAVYEDVCRSGLMLEQEKLPPALPGET